MHRQPYDDREEARVWLSAGEVEQFLAGLTDTRQRIAFGLGLRCGLRPKEIVNAAPADLVDGPAGVMLRVEADSNEEQYRETPVPTGLTTGIRTIDDVREEPSAAPLVGVGRGRSGAGSTTRPKRGPPTPATRGGEISRPATCAERGRLC